MHYGNPLEVFVWSKHSWTCLGAYHSEKPSPSLAILSEGLLIGRVGHPWTLAPTYLYVRVVFLSFMYHANTRYVQRYYLHLPTTCWWTSPCWLIIPWQQVCQYELVPVLDEDFLRLLSIFEAARMCAINHDFRLLSPSRSLSYCQGKHAFIFVCTLVFCA